MTAGLSHNLLSILAAPADYVRVISVGDIDFERHTIVLQNSWEEF